MKIIGMARVKNESRWISRVLNAALTLCDEVLVFDDHSTDDTPGICRLTPRVTLIESPFEGLDESRDKNWMLWRVAALKPDAILFFDGDEELEPSGAEKIRAAISRNPHAEAWSLPIIYLWDSPDQMRADGVYGRFKRPSVFRWIPGRKFGSTTAGGNFHCGNVPGPIHQRKVANCDARLLHFGYLHREDRIRKFDFYSRIDPNNELEGRYLHVVQGDVPEVPPDIRLKHAGPLRLQPVSL